MKVWIVEISEHYESSVFGVYKDKPTAILDVMKFAMERELKKSEWYKSHQLRFDAEGHSVFFEFHEYEVKEQAQ